MLLLLFICLLLPSLINRLRKIMTSFQSNQNKNNGNAKNISSPLDIMISVYDEIGDKQMKTTFKQMEKLPLDRTHGIRLCTITKHGLFVSSWIWSDDRSTDRTNLIIPGMPVLDGVRSTFISTQDIASKCGSRSIESVLKEMELPLRLADMCNSLVPEFFGQDSVELSDARNNNPMKYYSKNEQTKTKKASIFSSVVFHTPIKHTLPASLTRDGIESLLHKQDLHPLELHRKFLYNSKDPNTSKIKYFLDFEERSDDTNIKRSHPPTKEISRVGSEQTFWGAGPCDGFLFANTRGFEVTLLNELTVRDNGAAKHHIKRFESFPLDDLQINTIALNGLESRLDWETFLCETQDQKFVTATTTALATSLGQQAIQSDFIDIKQLPKFIKTFIETEHDKLKSTTLSKNVDPITSNACKYLVSLDSNHGSILDTYKEQILLYHGNWLEPNSDKNNFQLIWQDLLKIFHSTFVALHGIKSQTGAISDPKRNVLLDFTFRSLQKNLETDGILSIHAMLACLCRIKLGSNPPKNVLSYGGPRKTFESMNALGSILLCRSNSLDRTPISNNNNNNPKPIINNNRYGNNQNSYTKRVSY